MNNKGFTLIELVNTLFVLLVGVGGLYGWIMNIVTIFHSNFTPLTGQLVLRVVGVFLAPIGAIMGYL